MLDERYRDMWVRTLCDLVRIPSRSSTGGGEELAVQRYVARRMSDAGARVRTFEAADVPEFFEHPLCCGPRRQYRDRPTVLGEVGPAEAPALLVMAHSDTVQVFEPDKWTRDPFDPVVRDGRVFGLGACDDKSGLASMLTTLDALRDQNISATRRVIFASTIDEENGVGNGLLLLHLAGVKAESALYLDGNECNVLLGQLGGSSIRLRPVIGIDSDRFAAHGRALDAACRRLSEKRAALFDRPLFRANTQVHKSVTFSVLGDVTPARLQVSFYTLPGEDGAALHGELERMIDHALGADRGYYEWQCRQPWFEAVELSPDLPLAQCLARALGEDVGREPVFRTVSKQDAFVLTNHARIPTVSFGAAAARGPNTYHEPDESVRIDMGWDHLRATHRVARDWLTDQW